MNLKSTHDFPGFGPERTFSACTRDSLLRSLDILPSSHIGWSCKFREKSLESLVQARMEFFNLFLLGFLIVDFRVLVEFLVGSFLVGSCLRFKFCFVYVFLSTDSTARRWRNHRRKTCYFFEA